MMKIMGIDIGTTSISIVYMLGESGDLLAQETMNHKSFLSGEPTEERIQDPERIWLLTKEKADMMMKMHGKPDAIGVTGQMHGMLYADCDGNAVSPLYTWQDGRGNRVLEEGKSSACILKERVGAAAPGYGLTTHFYLQRTGEIPEKAVKMATISDYIIMKLCGHKKPVMGIDMAASWGCFDLEKREFKYRELQAAGVNISYLPDVRKEHFFAGKTEDGIPVMASIGDNQASVLGSVSDLSDTVLINVGTGSQVSFATENYVSCEGSLELRPCTKDSYLLVGSSLCGGRAYAMLEQFYREISGRQEEDNYRVMYEQAQNFIENYGVDAAWRIQTTFSGTRGNPAEKGKITDIDVKNFCPGAMTVGMIASILEELHEQYRKMCEISGKRAHRLVASGNGIRRNPLMQRLAEEKFGMRIEIPRFQEEAAYGAALCAFALLDESGGLKEAQKKIHYL